MDRRGKKLEKKRAKREQAKKKALALAARKPSATELLIRSGARGEFGPCFVSAQWDDLQTPALVTVVVTRKVSGELVPAVALVDRTCLGVKNAFVVDPMLSPELADFIETVGEAHGGMFPCEPLVAQSIVFHAIDYARSLGFEPHRDFPSALFGPRPEQLLETPWHTPERPSYILGPHDNARAIVHRLSQAVGPDGFDVIDPLSGDDDEDDLEDDHELDAAAWDEGEEIIHSPLECTVSRDGVSLSVQIYRGASETFWFLEVEHSGSGSTTWDEPFETEQAALDEAMQAIETEGIRSFIVRETASG